MYLVDPRISSDPHENSWQVTAWFQNFCIHGFIDPPEHHYSKTDLEVQKKSFNRASTMFNIFWLIAGEWTIIEVMQCWTDLRTRCIMKTQLMKQFPHASVMWLNNLCIINILTCILKGQHICYDSFSQCSTSFNCHTLIIITNQGEKMPDAKILVIVVLQAFISCCWRMKFIATTLYYAYCLQIGFSSRAVWSILPQIDKWCQLYDMWHWIPQIIKASYLANLNISLGCIVTLCCPCLSRPHKQRS